MGAHERRRPVSYDDDLFEQIGRLLAPRHGWNFEPSPTPGAAPSWCLDPGGEVRLAVNVIEGKVCLYLPDRDQEIRFEGLNQLAVWLDRNEATFC